MHLDGIVPLHVVAAEEEDVQLDDHFQMVEDDDDPTHVRIRQSAPFSSMGVSRVSSDIESEDTTTTTNVLMHLLEAEWRTICGRPLPKWSFSMLLLPYGRPVIAGENSVDMPLLVARWGLDQSVGCCRQAVCKRIILDHSSEHHRLVCLHSATGYCVQASASCSAEV